jgi:hypothetical protein
MNVFSGPPSVQHKGPSIHGRLRKSEHPIAGGEVMRVAETPIAVSAAIARVLRGIFLI